MSEDLVAFLRARLDEDERIAAAASGRDGCPAGQPEEWRWECCTDDTPLDIDLAIAGGEETLDHGSHYRVGLRSVQCYPTASVGPLSHLVIDGEEVRPQDARHIACHDPARALREVEAKRAILYRCERQAAREHENCMEEDRTWVLWPVLFDLAGVYSDHADYRPEWKPAP